MSEDEAYKELKSLQGSTVPYYYGMHTVNTSLPSTAPFNFLSSARRLSC